MGTQVSELPEATEAHEEHASEDTLGLHENVTLDVMVAAALSASAHGCHCSTGELRNCGSRCFSLHGSQRIGCITSCLDASHHAHWCSQCYAQRSDCTMNHCLNNCASNPQSSQCTGCVHSHCGGIAAEVSGEYRRGPLVLFCSLLRGSRSIFSFCAQPMLQHRFAAIDALGAQ